MAEDYLDRVYKDLWTQYGKVGYKEQAGEELMQLLYGMIGRMEIMEKRLAEHRELPMQHRADRVLSPPVAPFPTVSHSLNSPKEEEMTEADETNLPPAVPDA